MWTLAMLEGFGSPIHWILLLCVCAAPVVAVVVLIVVMARTQKTGAVGPRIAVHDAELERRRQKLALDEKEIELEERRRALRDSEPRA